MQVRISDEAAASIQRLVEFGAFEDATDAVERAICLLTESLEDYIEEVRAKILKSAESLDAGRGTLLTKEVAERIKREGRERLERRQRSLG